MRSITSITVMFLIALAGCMEPELKEQVIDSHPNGNKKKVHYYRGRQSNIERKVIYFADGKIHANYVHTGDQKPQSDSDPCLGPIPSEAVVQPQLWIGFPRDPCIREAGDFETERKCPLPDQERSNVCYEVLVFERDDHLVLAEQLPAQLVELIPTYRIGTSHKVL